MCISTAMQKKLAAAEFLMEEAEKLKEEEGNLAASKRALVHAQQLQNRSIAIANRNAE